MQPPKSKVPIPRNPAPNTPTLGSANLRRRVSSSSRLSAGLEPSPCASACRATRVSLRGLHPRSCACAGACGAALSSPPGDAGVGMGSAGGLLLRFWEDRPVVPHPGGGAAGSEVLCCFCLRAGRSPSPQQHLPGMKAAGAARLSGMRVSSPG